MSSNKRSSNSPLKKLKMSSNNCELLPNQKPVVQIPKDSLDAVLSFKWHSQLPNLKEVSKHKLNEVQKKLNERNSSVEVKQDTFKTEASRDGFIQIKDDCVIKDNKIVTAKLQENDVIRSYELDETENWFVFLLVMLIISV